MSLRLLAKQQYSETGPARIVGTFLIRLSQLAPRDCQRSMTALIEQLDSDSYGLRMAMLEVLGNLLIKLREQASEAQVRGYLGAIEERLLDVNAFVRAKALATLGEACKASVLPPSRRPAITERCLERLMDRSAAVRKKSIQLLGDLVRTHPFGVEGGELRQSHFEERLRDLEKLLAEKGPEDELLSTLLLQQRYYTDALAFCQQLNRAMPLVAMLLQGGMEVIDIMDLLVDLHAYRLQSSLWPIRKMMHLVWEERASEETESGNKRSVREHLIDSYRRIYLEMDERLGLKERSLSMAQNLLS